MTTEPQALGQLATWLRTAKPGQCPCGAPLPVRRFGPKDDVLLCGSKACRAHYKKLHQQDRGGGTTLQAVVSVTLVPDKPRHRRVNLACGHFEVMPQSLAKRRDKRRRCPTCAAQAPGEPPAPAP